MKHVINLPKDGEMWRKSVILETHLTRKYSFCYLCSTDTVYVTLQKKWQLIAACRAGTIKPHPFICSGKIAGKDGLGQAGKDYNRKISVFGMYIFQWFQQNIVMAVYLLICWDCFIYFFLTPDDFNEVRDRKTRIV